MGVLFNLHFTVFYRGKMYQTLNEEQLSAVANIIKAKNYPLPYLLFGPPGTGKTHTLTATVEEILLSSPSNHVLVYANTNTACDEITTRLLKVLPAGDIFRMYAHSYDRSKISKEIAEICNWIENKYCFPPLVTLYSFRVIICTMTVSAYLKDSGDILFRPNHFSHIIIDECANSHESMSLVPIAGRIFVLFFFHFNQSFV